MFVKVKVEVDGYSFHRQPDNAEHEVETYETTFDYFLDNNKRDYSIDEIMGDIDYEVYDWFHESLLWDTRGIPEVIFDEISYNYTLLICEVDSLDNGAVITHDGFRNVEYPV